MLLLVLSCLLTVAAACDSAVNERNLALHKPAHQSSTYGNRHHAFLAVDGSRTTWEGYFGCAFTNYDQYAWWSVDLGSSQTVREVYVTGRADCCGDRLKDFNVGITDNDPTTTAPALSPLNYEICHRFVPQVPQGARQRIQCDSPVTGRYLIVQLTGTNYLTLCVVEVYSDSYVYDNNLALGKTTSQSSLYIDGTANYAVDGIWEVFALTAPNKCTHTLADNNPGPWWAVDLGSSYDVGEVWLQNRQDCCSERLRDFYVGVTDDAPSAVAPTPFPNPTYQVCYHQTGMHFNVATRAQIVCNRVLSGQYVIVQLAYVEYLTLCEVEVYAGKKW